MVIDRLHSVPAALEVLVDGAAAGVFATGLKADEASAAAPLDSTATVSIPMQAKGSTFRLVVAEVSERLTRDWYSNTFQPLPVSIAEVRLGANPVRLSPPTPVDTGCRDDLVSINSRPTPVRITGSVADAEARRPLNLQGCEPVTLTPNETLVMTASGANTGIDIDQLVLTSPAPLPPTPAASPDSAERAEAASSAPTPHSAAAAGAAADSAEASEAASDSDEGSGASASDPAKDAAAEVKVERHRDTSFTATVPPSDTGRWLVLAQSHNRGWQAVADGTDLGEPVVIDGYANGWWLPPGAETTVELRWTPQRLVDAALALSAIFTALTIALAWKGRRAKPPDPADGPPDTAAATEYGPALPQLIWPFAEPQRDPQANRPSPKAIAAAALATAALATLTLPQWPTWLPLTALLAAITAISLHWPRARPLPLAAAATALAAAAAWIMISQYRFRHPPDFAWPQRFEEANILGMLTILLIATTYLQESTPPRHGGKKPEAATR